MNARFQRLLPLGQGSGQVSGAAQAAWAHCAGAKASRLSDALRAGFPVLPGWVVPSAESRRALRAGAAAVRGGRPAAGRRAVLSCPPDPTLAAELREAVTGLGGRAIVRSSSPLENDPRWSGAFSSVAEVGPDDAATAVRSCWASAFAVDPLARLDACGLPLEALELGILIQPEIVPTAGGVARVTAVAGPGRAGRPGDIEVAVDGVEGHPGTLLSGWADGASARARLPGHPGTSSWPGQPLSPMAEGALTGLLGHELVGRVARLAEGIYRVLGDDTIEWAAADGKLWLLQSLATGAAATGRRHERAPVPARDTVDVPSRVTEHGRCAIEGGGPATDAPGRRFAAREWMPLLAAAVQAEGQHLRGRPAAAGTAAGRLVACRPHERPPADCRDAILLVERPLPALAPLLFAARGVIARSGAAGSHLAEVARSLAVPMVTGCHLDTITGSGPPGAPWLAAIDGTTGEVALLPG
jgi:phosphoenolpyruvate synthase/pyruvate phosphate dikinase